MALKILAIGDTADTIFTFKKFAKEVQIHLVAFPRKQDALLTTSEEGIEFFDSLLISKQVKRIKKIKDNFDICLVMTWAAARVAYLAGLNYIMYFTGNDIMTPPFIKKPSESYLDNPLQSLNFFERMFYKKVLDSAAKCVTTTVPYYNNLKKYRKDAVRIDRAWSDTELFNEHIKPINLPKSKFTFLSAQKIGLEKGFDVIWEALRLCKSDFELLQVKWFTERTEEEKKINQKLLESAPPQVKFIPLIKRDKLSNYIMFADAVLGQMRSGIQGSIERDAALCKKPSLCYTDPNMPLIIDDKEIIPPFLPKTRDPRHLAELIDKIVESKEFRESLAKEEHDFVKEIVNHEKTIKEWINVFNDVLKDKTIDRNMQSIKNKIENLIVNLIEKLFYVRKMRKKNIRAWGKVEYERLTK